MKLSVLISEFADLLVEHGDAEVTLQNCGCEPMCDATTGHESFFVIAEEYELDDGSEETVINLRAWPY